MRCTRWLEGKVLLLLFHKVPETNFSYPSLSKFTQFLSFTSESLIYYQKHH